jgi:sodium pump decarboxylase gamma subunit
MSGFLNTAVTTFLSVDGKLHFENIDVGIMTTILGVAIVFLILVIICLMLTIFSIIVKDKSKPSKQKQSKPSPLHKVIPVKTAPVQQSEPVKNEMDDKQLVAVITAAIAASMDTDIDHLVVRRIRRVGNWNQEAIEQQQSGLY